MSSKGMKTMFKAAATVVTLLVMMIPLNMIRGLGEERKDLARGIQKEIISGAGGHLELKGPVLILPYESESQTETSDGRKHTVRTRHEMIVPADEILIQGDLDVQYRHRGIYTVPVYTGVLECSGTFTVPSNDIFPAGAVPLPKENRLAAGIVNMQGIRDVSELSWNGELIDFNSGHGPLGNEISARISSPENGRAEIKWSMTVSGGGSVMVSPTGRNSELILSGNWPFPSFQGERLPDERQLDENSFSARWRIPEVSRPISPYWTAGADEPDIRPVSVELRESVSPYLMAERSVKYGVLFLLIPFVVFFLFETLGKIRIHPVRYLMAGAADVLFYLLLLALSEHAAFALAFWLAAAAVTLLIAFYSYSMGRAVSLAMAIVLGAAYVWLWVTLQSEDYALVIGSAGLFFIVALVMILTRNVDWYRQIPEPVIRKRSGLPQNSPPASDNPGPPELPEPDDSDTEDL